VLGELVTCKVTAEQTGGAYSLFEVVSQPLDGPLPYIEHQEDECFYVLEGEFEFLDNDRTLRAGAGSLIYTPRGNLRAYKNVGDDPGRMLVSQTPGGLHEMFFEEVGEEAVDKVNPPVVEGPPDAERIVAIATKYGIEIPPPAK
jgi:mannose-6-phosphate isomerase-like protein (cupin superfamily)